MRFFIRLHSLLILMLFLSCKHQTRLSGIVVDKLTKQPLNKVGVRTLTGAQGTQLQYARTETKRDGRFTLRFSSQQVSANELLVEFSKKGYVANMYAVFQDRPNDTIFLDREY